MRTRRAALGAALLLTLSVGAAACNRPRPPGQPQDCGRIDLNAPNAGDAAKVRCYNQYHLPPFPAVKLVTVERVNGSTVTKTFQTPGTTHKVTITTATTNAAGVTTTTVQECGQDGAPFNAGKGQTFLDSNGRVILQSC
jgi:hypothetical protein